jgi:hypothetical protein
VISKFLGLFKRDAHILARLHEPLSNKASLPFVIEKRAVSEADIRAEKKSRIIIALFMNLNLKDWGK